MKKLLLLGGPVFQKPVVERAKAMGLRVGVADISPDAPAAQIADDFFCGSIRDFDAMLEIAKEYLPDAIASGACDTSVVTVSKLCEELGLPGNSVEAALNSTDKHRMIECFARKGVAHPSFVVAKKEDIGHSPLKSLTRSSRSRQIVLVAVVLIWSIRARNSCPLFLPLRRRGFLAMFLSRNI